MTRTQSSKHYLRHAWQLPCEYLTSLFDSRVHGNTLRHVRTFFFFIGNQRSGHSVIGSLLDAHPEIVCSHELNVMKYLYLHFSRRQIACLMLEKALRTAGRKKGGYFYGVKSQWQGTYKQLLALGDKKGEGTVFWLHRHPRLLDRLQRTFDLPIKVFQVVRNPYDSIATLSRRFAMPLEDAVGHYFGIWGMISGVVPRLNESDFQLIHHEAFLHNPQATLDKACAFLGIEAGARYLDDCSRIVLKQPSRTRFTVPWPDPLIKTVRDRAAAFPPLRTYRYEA
mgnify:CR=1 FL=1